MARLEDFTEEQVSLDSLLVGQGSLPPRRPSRASNVNLAAHVAMLSDNPEEVELSFRVASSELEGGANKETIDYLLQTARGRNQNKARSALVEFLADPQQSDEDKREVAERVLDIEDEQYNVSNSLSYETLEMEDGESTGESEFVRVSLANGIREMNEYKREQQALLNREIASMDFSVAGAMYDIVEYFFPFMEQKFVGSVLSKAKEDKGAYTESVLSMGSSKTDLKDMIKSIPHRDRMDFVQKVVNWVEESKTIAIVNDNDFAKMEMLYTLLEDGYYEDSDKLIDNIVSILDLSGLALMLGRSVSTLASIPRVGRLGQTIEVSARDASRRAFRSRVGPSTPSQNVKDTNPTLSRAIHEAVSEGQTDELAGALYGVSRMEALSSDLLPEIATVSGKVVAKIPKPDANKILKNATREEIIDFATNRGSLQYLGAEKAAMRSKVLNDFEQVEGMRARKEMFQIDSVGDGAIVRGVYGPTKSGYSDPERAMEMAMWSLRDYGVDKKDITLLARRGGEYYPTTVEEWKNITPQMSKISQKLLKAKGPKAAKNRDRARKSGMLQRQQPDFLIQVEHRYKFASSDVEEWGSADVMNNLFGRVGIFQGTSRQGSLQRMVLDPATTQHPRVFQSASAAVDAVASLESDLLRLSKEFTDPFSKLSHSRKVALDSVIREANDLGINLTTTRLTSQGFSPQEIDILKSWRNYWDTAWELENLDLVRTLRNGGYRELVDSSQSTSLFARPVKNRGSVGGGAKVYDYTNDTVMTLTPQQLDELYQSGGMLGQLRRPISAGEDVADYVISHEKPGGSYLRGLNDSSVVQNYRKGYYTVKYKDPHFVDKLIRNSRGEVIHRQAVATGGSIKDTRTYRDGLQAQVKEGENVEYVVRRDKKGGQVGTDTHWDIQLSRGRSTQKVRGDRLQDTSSNLSDPSQANILGPIESMVQSAKSLSERVAMRDMLEVNKSRLINNFQDLLPKNRFGQPSWPSNVRDIRYRGEGSENAKRVADARTAFEYIMYLEDGYINIIDDSIKSALISVADMLGGVGLRKTEAALNRMAEARGPSSVGKGLAADMYLSLGPLRQALVQGNQSIQLAANFPEYVTSQRMASEVSLLTAMQLGGKAPKGLLKSLGMSMNDAQELFNHWKISGLPASVDRHSLLRGSLVDMADRSAGIPGLGGIGELAGDVVAASRKVGFNAGEHFTMMTSWLAHRDRAIRAGRSMSDSEVRDEVTALARNFTYGMNRAGDMPYNQNALGLMFQFIQVPHKAATTWFLNRNIPKSERAVLAGFNGIMYGALPASAMYTLFNPILPEDPTLRDLAVNGLQGAAFNKALSLATGEETYIDWSTLSPLDMHGTYDFLHSLATMSPGTMMAESPAGSLFFGNNPRITNLVGTVSRFTNVVDDFENETEFMDVAKDFAGLASGMSHYFRYKYAREYRKVMASSGSISDHNVSKGEAIGLLLGMPTNDSTYYYAITQKMYEESKKFREDITDWYRESRRNLVRKGITPQEVEYMVKMQSEAWRVWGNDNQKAKNIVRGLIVKDMQSGQHNLYGSIMSAYGILSSSEIKAMFDGMSDLTPEERQNLKDTIDYMQNWKDET